MPKQSPQDGQPVADVSIIKERPDTSAIDAMMAVPRQTTKERQPPPTTAQKAEHQRTARQLAARSVKELERRAKLGNVRTPK